jgi:subtilisin
VLNGFPTGTTSSQLCGIDWVTANGPGLGIKVVNASMALFGAADDGNCGYTNGAVLHQAICRSTAAGILWVFSAGNNSSATIATNPGGGLDEVLAVTATADSNGTPNVGSTSSFTCPVLNGTRKNPNSGPEIDDKHASFATYAVTAADQAHTIAAPGACIWSTYKGSTYGYLSGSSMSAPQATAVAHLCITGGQCPGTPAQTIQKLRADAQAYTQANPGYGFTGDPLRPVTGKYFGYLVRAGLY